MGKLADTVIETRARRNSAREAFESNRAQIRADLDARGIGGRIADRLGSEAVGVYEEAVAIAEQHRGVVAGTVTALALWFLRNPLLAALDGLLELDLPDQEDHDRD